MPKQKLFYDRHAPMFKWKILSKLSQLANLFSGILKTLSNVFAGLQSLIHNSKSKKLCKTKYFSLTHCHGWQNLICTNMRLFMAFTDASQRHSLKNSDCSCSLGAAQALLVVSQRLLCRPQVWDYSGPVITA